MGRGVAALRPDGEILAGGSSLPTDFTYTGQRSEASLGLLDYRARMYDPLLARFLSADTVVPEPGNPQALNRYSYCGGNPVKYTDPTGHFEDDAELAKYLGFQSVEDMYKSPLWAQWSQDPAWLAMVRSKGFDFGSVLTFEGETPWLASGDALVQLMLVENEGRLAIWHINCDDNYVFGHLDDLFILFGYKERAKSWALFENNKPWAGVDSYSYSRGNPALPGPSFAANWASDEYGATVRRKVSYDGGTIALDGVIAFGSLIVAVGGTILGEGAASVSGEITPPAWVGHAVTGFSLLVGVAGVGKFIYDATRGEFVADTTYEYVQR